MGKPKPEKKPAAAAPPRVRSYRWSSVGDRLADETGDWEVISRPYTTAGGEGVRVRVRRVAKSDGTEIRTWGADERVSVKRATAEEDKR